MWCTRIDWLARCSRLVNTRLASTCPPSTSTPKGCWKLSTYRLERVSYTKRATTSHSIPFHSNLHHRVFPSSLPCLLLPRLLCRYPPTPPLLPILLSCIASYWTRLWSYFITSWHWPSLPFPLLPFAFLPFLSLPSQKGSEQGMNRRFKEVITKSKDTKVTGSLSAMTYCLGWLEARGRPMVLLDIGKIAQPQLNSFLEVS